MTVRGFEQPVITGFERYAQDSTSKDPKLWPCEVGSAFPLKVKHDPVKTSLLMFCFDESMN